VRWAAILAASGSKRSRTRKTFTHSGWNFTRSFEDDEGVCTVREPQRATFYDGIQVLEVSRSQLVCAFDPAVRGQAGCARLEIQLNIDDATWEKVAHMLDTVCTGKAFYRRR
jgi:hypothetical protein